MRIQREALESEYVSQNINNWIDLIWGYKQRGIESIKADNTFYYLTYEDSVDLAKIEDLNQRKALEEQMLYFGQAPSVLFKRPHPSRKPLPEIPHPVIHIEPHAIHFELLWPVFVFVADIPGSPFSQASRELVLVDTSLKCSSQRIFTREASQLVFERKEKLDRLVSSVISFSNLVGIKRPTLPSTVESHHLVLKDRYLQKVGFANDGRHCFVAGYFDNSFRQFSWSGSSLMYVDRVYEHLGIVTCACVSEDGKWLATGSKDTTVRIWGLTYAGDKCIVGRQSTRVFYGHEGHVIKTDLGAVPQRQFRPWDSR